MPWVCCMLEVMEVVQERVLNISLPFKFENLKRLKEKEVGYHNHCHKWPSVTLFPIEAGLGAKIQKML